jgi:hypothetical protein
MILRWIFHIRAVSIEMAVLVAAVLSAKFLLCTFIQMYANNNNNKYAWTNVNAIHWKLCKVNHD